MRLSYHETYPDIVQIKSQINDLRESVKQSEKESNNTLPTVIDERVLNNPIYQQLQRDLYNANTTIKTLKARLLQTEKTIDTQIARARKVEEYQTKLQELTRDYDVNNERYTDLVRRREQARVSMSLNKERKGLTLRIDEPAYRPHSPSGLRFLHFLLAGPIVGISIPIGLCFLILQFDFRIRRASDITDGLGINILGSTPHLASPVEARKQMISFSVVMVVFASTVAFVIAMGLLRMQGKI